MILPYFLLLAIDTHHQPRIPLHFEPNQGQIAGETEWIAKAPGGTLFIKSTAIVFAVAKDSAKKPRIMHFEGAKPVKGEGLEPTGGYSNYFSGRDEKNWHSGIPHFSKVRYKNLYKDIDLLYYSTPDLQIEYDLEVAPGADVEQIELSFDGFDGIDVNSDGDLVLRLGSHAVKQKRPKVVQDGRPVVCRYQRRDSGWGLALDGYDETRALTVDPVLDFSTYFGGPGGDEIRGIKLDSSGSIFLAGTTQTPAGPTLNPFQQPSIVLGSAFAAEMTSDAKRVVYYSVITSDGVNAVRDMGIDSQGSVTIAGYTTATNFPVRNAAQIQNNGAGSNWFATKFTPDGRSFVYSTYWGGSAEDILWGLAIDNKGNAVLAGNSTSRDFPAINAAQAQVSNLYNGYRAVVTKISPTGSILFSTYWSGESSSSFYSVRTDTAGNIYLPGGAVTNDYPTVNEIPSFRGTDDPTNNSILVKMSPEGSVLASTYLFPGSSSYTAALALDKSGSIYVAGGGWGNYLKPTANAFQSTAEDGAMAGYLMKLDPGITTVLNSTYLGGSGLTMPTCLQVDSTGALYVAGSTASADFPVKNSLFPYRGGPLYGDAFLLRIDPSLSSLDFSTLLGGSSDESVSGMAVDGRGGIYIAGATKSSDLPVNNAFQPEYGGNTDGFIARIIDDSPALRSPLTPLPGVLSFRGTSGGSIPPSQSISVTPTGIPFAASSSSAWLSAAASSTTVNVSVDPSGLTPGVYRGVVSLTPLGTGAPATIGVTFTLLASPPALTSLDPAVISVGADATPVTIHGSGFTKDSVVLLNGSSLLSAPPTFVDDGTLSILVPELFEKVIQSFTVTVQNPNSDPSNGLTLSIGPAVAFTAEGIVSAATLEPGPVAPGLIILISGSNLSGPVTFDGITARVLSATANQIRAIVPDSITGPQTTIRVGGLASAAVTLDVVASRPGIFSAQVTGGVISIAGTGVGVDLPVTVTVNGQRVGILSASVDGDGVNQFQVNLPHLQPYSQPRPLRIVLTAGNASSREFLLESGALPEKSSRGPTEPTTVAVVAFPDTLQSVPRQLPLAPASSRLFTADGSGTGGHNLSLPFTVSINGEASPVASVSPIRNQTGWFQVTTTNPSGAPTDSPVIVVMTADGKSNQAGMTLSLRVNQ